MKIVLQNETTHELGKKVEQVVSSVIEKMGAADQIEGFTIDANVLVKMQVKGQEEAQYIFTDRVIMGKQEIFTVVPEFDADGNLVAAQDNKEVTFEAVAEALSKELPTEAVESEFIDEDLTHIGSEIGGDLEEARYQHKDGFMVIKYYREGVGLVGEISATPKEAINEEK